MGSADYATLMPPHSVINVLDYESPEQLARYLHHLMDHDQEYEAYFKWKDTHHVEDMREAYKSGFCNMCENMNRENLTPKSYKELHDWWGKDTLCEKSTNWNF